MCGISGVIGQKGEAGETLLKSASRMADALKHRGPDAGGGWAAPDAALAFTHRRLSIIDLSPEGAQPMASPSGRYVITYNGEVYNFPELHKELVLSGVKFRGRSDTEIMLAAFDLWGVNRTLQKLIGMFAFALWDNQTRQVHLVRDRMGKKPLYVGWCGTRLLFASELKAFHAVPEFPADIDRGVLGLYLRYGFVPPPFSIYQGVWQVLPGCRVTIDTEHMQAGADLSGVMEPYWDMTRVVEDARARPIRKSDEQIIDDFEALLRTCVSDRMVSDVPLGAFLSGGIDSTAVVAMMQQVSNRPVKTYSIGFRENGYDEASHAEKIAAHLGTDHHTHYIEAGDAAKMIDQIPFMFDEPFADISQIPTYLVSKFAREDVTVALSGDGGDEMLGGYLRHFLVPSLWRKVEWMPAPLRAKIGRLIQRVPVERWDARMPRVPQFGRRLYKFADMMQMKGGGNIYLHQLSKWPHVEKIMPGVALPELRLQKNAGMPKHLNMAESIMAADAMFYLPGDVLVKADRASMAASLEMRAPLLDQRIFEYVWRLPLRFKTRQTGRGLNAMSGKWLLRQVLARYVPPHLFARPKQGFSVPVAAWLRGELKDWADGQLAPARLRREGMLDAEIVDAIWKDFLAGNDRHAEGLWIILMFQAWYDKWHARKVRALDAG